MIVKLILMLSLIAGVVMVIIEGVNAVDFDTPTEYYADGDDIPDGKSVGDPKPISQYDSDYPPFIKAKYRNELYFQISVLVMLLAIVLNLPFGDHTSGHYQFVNPEHTFKSRFTSN